MKFKIVFCLFPLLLSQFSLANNNIQREIISTTEEPLSEKDVNEFLDNKDITKINYKIDCDCNYEYVVKEGECPVYDKFSKEITNLPKLEEFPNCHGQNPSYKYYTLEKDTLSVSKKLKVFFDDNINTEPLTSLQSLTVL
ncbi:hypothetical protein PIROE2DRAFT_13593 [Piromyces sp. E2]|nr:hypothetical protein PIROE2DRAFT_13593 [Piromyces sp. E2]|eukprot:OUM60613.1 hypothetical protein PIROE2DRAFT_13593 [Piromyces sp. E2]